LAYSVCTACTASDCKISNVAVCMYVLCVCVCVYECVQKLIH